MGRIESQAKQAYGELHQAQSALAASDFKESEEQFAAAAATLGAARRQLDEALSASRYVLETLDVTGTVASGGRLLKAAEKVTAAGGSIAEGLQMMAEAKAVEGGEENNLVAALQAAGEKFRVADGALEEAEEALKGVKTESLPQEVRAQAEQLKNLLPPVREPLKAFVRESGLLLKILGSDRQRQYLLLFENNNEQRPTGGFIGSLALVNVDRGRVEDVNVQTVYDPDGQLKEFIAPPDPLRSIVDRWYLRDANWFVDWRVSAKKIAALFEKEGGPTVDGVIAITPDVIERLLEITGPIEMPQYGVTVSKDNFVPLTQEEVTYNYDKDANKPKQFLADLAPTLLTRVFTAQSKDSLKLLRALSGSLREKHILIYLHDREEQQRAEEAKWSGVWPKAAAGFLSINNANIGGHKSDQFIEQEVDYRSDIKDNGDVEVMLTIRRTHHGPEEKLPYEYPEGEDPALKDNIVYERVFVPSGAELLEAKGFTRAADIPHFITPRGDMKLVADEDVAEWQRLQAVDESGTTLGREAGYDYFANWQITKPGETTIGLYRYRLPKAAAMPSLWRPATTYSLFVAKQPGDTRTSVRTEVHLPQNLTIRHTVPQDGITLTQPGTATYRGALKEDLAEGVVMSSPD